MGLIRNRKQQLPRRGELITTCHMQPLESRRLLTVINVGSYGVNPNDATRAIQAAFSASEPGDTIIFPTGTYKIGSQITIPGNRTLVGNGSILIAPAKAYCFQNDRNGNPNNLSISGFEVKGRFLRIEAWAGWSSNIEIFNNTFDPFNFYTDKGTEHESIFITNGGKNINIHNNTANGTVGDGWIVGYGAQNVSITDNLIENLSEGIHYLGQYGVTNGLTISRNLFENNHAMNVEVQGSGSGLVVEGNIIQGANITSNFKDNMSSFGFSLSGEGFVGTTVDHNKIVSYDRADGTGLREAFEIAGISPNVYENDIEGTNQAGVLNTSKNGWVHDNRVVGAFKPFTAYAGRSPGAVLSNNGDIQLDWDPATYSLPTAGAAVSAASNGPSLSNFISVPFSGTPINIPARIQAEDFDSGGQAVAFNTTATGNNGDGYRDTPISISQTTDTGGGYALSNLVKGEWLSYTINVKTAGTYAIGMRFGSNGGSGIVHFEADWQFATAPIGLSGNPGQWMTLTTGGVKLSAGSHVIRFVVDSANSGDLGTINWFDVTRTQ